MAEFIAFVHGPDPAEGPDAADRADTGAGGSADAGPPHRLVAVLVTVPAAAAASPALAARLAASWDAPDGIARGEGGGADGGIGDAGAANANANADADADTDTDTDRLRRLAWLAGAGIRCHAIVVDARASDAGDGAAPGAGLRQIVHGAIHEAVAGIRRDTEIRTDAAGVAALAAGLARHAAARYEADLFRPEPPVRAADPGAAPIRLAGMLARWFGRGGLLDGAPGAAGSAGAGRGSGDGESDGESGGRSDGKSDGESDGHDAGGASPLGEALRAGWLTLEAWPPAPDRDPPARGAGDEAADAAIRQAAVESAWRFIADTPFPRDEDGRIQRIVLTRLLSTALYGDGGYTGSGELLESLASLGYGNLKEHYLQSAIVAGLRDSGVLVTSSSQGYKIPQDRQDVMDFVNLVDGQVIPLLDRLARVRRTLGAAGAGPRSDADGGAGWILGDERHVRLRRVLDALEDGAPSAPSAPPDGMPPGAR